MGNHQIAVLPGDGIGPEVIKEGMKILNALSEIDSTFMVESTNFNWNSEHYLEHGCMMPSDGLEQLQKYDAIFFGAIGDKRVSDHIPVWELIMPIRKQFQQYVNLRPIKQLRGINNPLKEEHVIDFYVFRENAEGEYSDIGGSLYTKSSQELAVQNTIITRQGVERLSKYAFEYAKEHKLTKVTNATKSNAIIHSMKLWDGVVKEVAENYKDIQLENIYVDALAAYFVTKPQSFEAVVASNLFGDILTDLGAALVGGLGISPSANLNPERNFPSMFEPIHGSAPDIAGKGIANPIATIWSASLMLEHLGRPDLAKIVLHAIEYVVEEGITLTPDLGGKSKTHEVGDAVLKAIYKQT